MLTILSLLVIQSGRRMWRLTSSMHTSLCWSRPSPQWPLTLMLWSRRKGQWKYWNFAVLSAHYTLGITVKTCLYIKTKGANAQTTLDIALISLLGNSSLFRYACVLLGDVIWPYICCCHFSPVSQLQGQIPAIVGAVHRQLREKSIKTRQSCFSLLTELVQVLPGALTDHIPAIVPGIQFSLGSVHHPT